MDFIIACTFCKLNQQSSTKTKETYIFCLATLPTTADDEGEREKSREKC